MSTLASGDFPTTNLTEHYELEYPSWLNSCRSGKRLWCEIVRIEVFWPWRMILIEWFASERHRPFCLPSPLNRGAIKTGMEYWRGTAPSSLEETPSHHDSSSHKSLEDSATLRRVEFQRGTSTKPKCMMSERRHIREYLWLVL